jgi:hypothetical protein
MDRDAVVRALQVILPRSPHFPLLFRRATQFGISTGREGLLVNLDFAQQAIDFQHVPDVAEARAPLWIELRERELLAFASDARPIPTLKVVRPPSSADLLPSIERLLLRVFTPPGTPTPVTDREDLVYDALFGPREPQQLWKSDDLPVQVLFYPEAVNGLHAYVTSGFSDPELGPPAPVQAAALPPSGFGYEMILLDEQPLSLLAGQFVAWTRYVCSTREHIVPGNWLEYSEGGLPGTTLAGFLIVPPVTLPRSFPVGPGEAQWSLLLGATAEELDLAKRTRVMEVAQKLLEAGYRDVTPLQRASVV